MSFSWLGWAGLGRVDPDGIGQRRGARRFADEAFGMLLEGFGEDALPVVQDLGGKPVLDQVRCQQGDAAVVVFVVVPVEEDVAMGAGVFQRAEAIRELGPVLQGLELAFRERVVIGDIGPAVRLGEPILFPANVPARSLTPLFCRNSATGRVFGTSASPPPHDFLGH